MLTNTQEPLTEMNHNVPLSLEGLRIDFTSSYIAVISLGSFQVSVSCNCVHSSSSPLLSLFIHSECSMISQLDPITPGFLLCVPG